MKITLLRILDHDLHRSKTGESTPLMLETPARPEFVPAIVSSTKHDKFLTSRRLTSDGMIRSGVFKYEQNLIDDVIPYFMKFAYELSILEKWNNIHDNPKKAFDFITEVSGLKSQPHACLVPKDWDEDKLKKFFGKSFKGSKYFEICTVYPCGVSMPIFLSRPDFVGLYTQLIGGMSSIILHNIRNGISFCKLK